MFLVVAAVGFVFANNGKDRQYRFTHDEVAAADLPLFMRMMSSIGPSIGADHGSAVSDRYRAPFAYCGTLHQVVIQASPERHADTAAAEDRAGMGRQ